jgi:hypothetical protein
MLRLREQLIRKCRSIQQQIKAMLLQHGVAEPAWIQDHRQHSLKVVHGRPWRATSAQCPAYQS